MNMTKYIFSVDAIATDQMAIAGAYNNRIVIIKAKDIEEALATAEKRFARNDQFRFEYKYVGKE